MRILIRKLQHSDYLGIIDLYNKSFNKNIMYHDIEEKDNKFIIVVETDNTIIGFTEINILDNEIENNKFVIINNICLEKEYINSKIETLLLETIEKISKKYECSDIFIMKNNYIELDTYKNLGFDISNIDLIQKQIA